ncbi:MAG: hypothetical protein U9N81_05325 [Bacillota bacterium]|nr:hypothetical protein [Bacillota bacterium]
MVYPINNIREHGGESGTKCSRFAVPRLLNERRCPEPAGTSIPGASQREQGSDMAYWPER